MKGTPHKSKKIYLSVSEASLLVIASGPGASMQEEAWKRGKGGEDREGREIRGWYLCIGCW